MRPDKRISEAMTTSLPESMRRHPKIDRPPKMVGATAETPQIRWHPNAWRGKRPRPCRNELAGSFFAKSLKGNARDLSGPPKSGMKLSWITCQLKSSDMCGTSPWIAPCGVA